MIKAWFMMASSGNNPRPKIQSMRDYAKYRNEMSSVMSDAQSGKKNSQWGKHWYTNRDTGECNCFLTAPNEKWIIGRNLFKGENSKLQINKIHFNVEYYLKAKMAWDEFHSGNYTSIRDFCRKTKKFNQPNLIRLFKIYIPISNTFLIGRSHNNKSNKSLVGKYFQE